MTAVYEDPSQDPEWQLLRKALGPDQGLLDAFRAGLDMEVYTAQPAAAAMVRECNDKIQAAFNTFLTANTEDLDSKEVRRAHHDARVALDVLHMIRSTIEAGREAETILRGDDAEEKAVAEGY